ncbi:MoxR family ATPase [Luteococcus sanguinis]|uniref:MoxR family ATPase n=1 Tax=Luteococcus sanguinis TaxID=174038 RepID=A0ABW1X003_9ACTN
MTHHPQTQVYSAAEAAGLAQRVLDAVDGALVGRRAQMELVLAAVLAGGHVLVEDLPGLGKTLAARSLAQAIGLKFTRAQFTPDLLPSDLTGSFVYNRSTGEFTFREGPVFTGLLLADEINRTPPKTQAALLEAMQEGQVSVEGQTFALPRPFHVIATANPIEHEGTYRLPEAQLDRFLLRLAFGLPEHADEVEMVRRRVERRQAEQSVETVLDAERLLALQASVETVYVSEAIQQYAVDLVRATREHQSALVGASPRGSLALVTCGRAVALLRGRDHVVPEDLKELAVPALAHRITLRPELWLGDETPAQVVRAALASVPVPDARR